MARFGAMTISYIVLVLSWLSRYPQTWDSLTAAKMIVLHYQDLNTGSSSPQRTPIPLQCLSHEDAARTLNAQSDILIIRNDSMCRPEWLHVSTEMTLFGAVGKWVVWCFKSRFCHSLNSTSCHDLLLPKFSLSIPPLSHPPLRGYAFLNSHEESWLSSQDHVGFPLSKVLRRGESLLLKYVLKALSRPLFGFGLAYVFTLDWTRMDHTQGIAICVGLNKRLATFVLWFTNGWL